VDSEYKPLEAVLLCRPHPKIENVDNPKKALHLAKINYAIIEKEFEQIIKLYKKLKIKVFFIDPFKIESSDEGCVLNLIFTRDHFFMTPAGAIMARMFSDIRRSEVKYAERTLKAAGACVRKVIRDSGTFEGADALWVDSRLVIVGVGNRTNPEGFQQIKEELRENHIKCVCVPAPQGVLHLLGALQFIDSDLALIRADLVDPEIINLLKENKIKMIMLSESSEISKKQAMNFVTVAPRTVIMSAGCPHTKKIYEKSGIRIAAETLIPQLVRGGGGLACATGARTRTGK